jgi:malonyl-CoA decarboxylase
MTRSHSSKSLAVLLRARMHPDPLPSPPPQPSPPPPTDPDPASSVRHWLHASASASSPPAASLDRFSDGYRSLDHGGRREVLRSLATEYDVPRARVRDLMRQYMSLASAAAAAGGEEAEEGKEGAAASLYRMERGLRDALQPRYSGFLEAMNAQPGGLKLLAVLRADLLALLG